MRSTELTIAQTEALKQRIATQLSYLNRVCDRMNQLGFVPDDALFDAALRAREALQDLHVQCHYATCTHGVAKAVE